MADIDNAGRGRVVTALAEDKRWVAAYRSASMLLLAALIGIIGWQGSNIVDKLDELRTTVAAGTQRMNGFDERLGRNESDIAKGAEDIRDLDRRTTRLETRVFGR